MRAFHVISLCALLLVLGGFLALRQSSTLPAASTITPLPSNASPVPPPAPQLSSRRSAPAGAPATAGLACIQNALGGPRAFADVASLRIIGNTKPVATTGMRPVSNNR